MGVDGHAERLLRERETVREMLGGEETSEKKGMRKGKDLKEGPPTRMAS